MLSENTVLSIPAGPSFHLVETCNTYACPSGRKRHQKVQYVTFRRSGGVMTRIWRIDEVRRVDASLSGLTADQRSAVRKYLTGYGEFGHVHQGAHRFYFLTPMAFALNHAPRVERNNANIAYFRLDDLRDPRHPVVSPIPARLR